MGAKEPPRKARVAQVPRPQGTPSPARAPQLSTHLMVHGPVLGAVPALSPVAVESLTEALPHHEAVLLLPPGLAGAGVGDVGAVHELRVFRPVVETDPAAALHLRGDRLLTPTALRQAALQGEAASPRMEAQIHHFQDPSLPPSPRPSKPPGSEFRFHSVFWEPQGI